MPGRFALLADGAALADRLRLGAVPDDPPPRWNVSPGQEILAVDERRVLRAMRWGIIPVGRVNARGRPVMETIINARSETVFDKSAFDGVGRAVVPASHWYEWTGKARSKTAWRIARADGLPLIFAAIWDRWAAPGGSVTVDQVATVTCEPNADVRDIHHRMGVLLEAEAVEVWLQGTAEEAQALCRPAPDGSLVVSRADDVDWSGP